LCAFEESADYMLCFHLFAKIQTCTYPYSSNRLYSPQWRYARNRSANF